MPRHLTLAELEAGLPEILQAPKDNGTLAAIVIRPEPGERIELARCEVNLKLGTHGDNWASGCWKTTDDGSPHPDRWCSNRSGPPFTAGSKLASLCPVFSKASLTAQV